MELEQLRSEIDKIDDQLISLFSQRMALSAQIADYKKAKGMPIHVPSREQEKLKDVASKAGDLAPFTQKLFETLFALSREYQAEKQER